MHFCVIISAFATGINADKTHKLLASVRLIDPVKTKSYENHRKLKIFIMDLREDITFEKK